MLDGAVVVDAVVHPYNLEPANQNPASHDQLEAVYGAHVLATGPDHPEHLLDRDEFFSDFPFEAIADSLFVESPTDLAIIHALPNLGFALGHVTDPDRAAAFRDRHPDRLRLYATVDTPATDAAIARLERQVRELGIDGLKLYCTRRWSRSSPTRWSAPRCSPRSSGHCCAPVAPTSCSYGSGTNLSHPVPLLSAFDGYELPADLVAEHGFPQLTAEDRHKILGGNALRLHGIDAATVLAATADDDFARRRASGATAWGHLRAGATA